MPPAKPKVTLACENCGKQYQKLQSTIRGQHQFCSQTCKGAWQTKNKSGANSPHYKSVIAPCAQCGKQLERHPKRVADAANQFCDYECLHLWRVGKYFGETTRIELVCEGCSQTFTKPSVHVKNRKQHYCSFECYRQHVGNKITLICPQCDKQFERAPSQVKGREQCFCSRKCQMAWRSQNQKGDKWPGYKKQAVPCSQCGKELLRAPSSIRERNFCDQICFSQWKSTQTGKKAPRWAGGMVQVSCSTCGKPLERPQNAIERSDRFFCDLQCRGAWMSANITGENHPMWKGGWWPNYGPNWDEQRVKARKRDGNKCQHCGMTQKKLGKELDVHHIKPFRTYGYIPNVNDNYLQANELSNLTTLCPTCHHKAEWGKIPVRLPLF